MPNIDAAEKRISRLLSLGGPESLRGRGLDIPEPVADDGGLKRGDDFRTALLAETFGGGGAARRIVVVLQLIYQLCERFLEDELFQRGAARIETAHRGLRVQWKNEGLLPLCDLDVE